MISSLTISLKQINCRTQPKNEDNPQEEDILKGFVSSNQRPYQILSLCRKDEILKNGHVMDLFSHICAVNKDLNDILKT